MQRRLLVIIAGALLAIGLAACGSTSGASTTKATDAQITIDSAFTFHSTPVAAGSTVTIRNDSASDHTVTQDSAGFDVAVPANGTATFTAPAAGTYAFHCKIHPTMHGTLTVT
jgi:plastocyanin